MNLINIILEKIKGMFLVLQEIDEAMTTLSISDEDDQSTLTNEKVREYFNDLNHVKFTSKRGTEYYYNKPNIITDTFNKIDKIRESSFGDFARAYEEQITSLVATLSLHRKDGEIEILPENIESFLKTVSNIYDVLCNKEKEVQSEEKSERLKWVEFGEEASNKVNKTMEDIKEEIIEKLQNEETCRYRPTIKYPDGGIELLANIPQIFWWCCSSQVSYRLTILKMNNEVIYDTGIIISEESNHIVEISSVFKIGDAYKWKVIINEDLESVKNGVFL